MKRINRLRRDHAAEWNMGERIGHRHHVGESNLTIIRACRAILGKRRSINFGRNRRDARHSLYRGAISAHKADIALYRRYRF